MSVEKVAEYLEMLKTWSMDENPSDDFQLNMDKLWFSLTAEEQKAIDKKLLLDEF